MSKVLALNSSALGSASVSNQLVQDALAQLRARDPALEVTVRDLGTDPVPHLNTDWRRHCGVLSPRTAHKPRRRRCPVD